MQSRFVLLFKKCAVGFPFKRGQKNGKQGKSLTDRGQDHCRAALQHHWLAVFTGLPCYEFLNCIASHAIHQPFSSTPIAYHIFSGLSNYILHIFLNYYDRMIPFFLLRFYQLTIRWRITPPYASSFERNTFNVDLM